MQFRATFCDPFKPDIIELGSIDSKDIINKFKSIPWRNYLEQMGRAHENDIHYSPSLEIENTQNQHGLTISAVDDGKDGIEYYTFYKRPKLITRFFGLVRKMNNNYLTEIIGQTEDEAIRCLTALINNELDFLEKEIR